MYKDLPDSYSQFSMFLSPVVKTNKLMASNFEKLVAFQMSAFQAYVDLSMSQIKAAADITSPEDAQAFFKSQVEFGEKLREKIMADFKTLTDMGSGMKDEFSKLAEENVGEITKASRAAVKQAA